MTGVRHGLVQTASIGVPFDDESDFKAAVLTGEGLAIREVPVPEPKPNDVLVKVSASGLNRADLIMAAGKPHGVLGGAGAIAGLEWAGEVAAIGDEVPEFRPGDRVMCSGVGGYAERNFLV